MRRAIPTALLALACASATVAALAGCGSQTKTVSAAESSTPPSAQATTTAGKTARTAPPAATGTTGASSSSATTRTAPQPAFAQPEGRSEAARAAVALVRAHGYTPNDPGEYHSDQTLRVLVGTRTGSGDGYGQQAFFFLDGRYLGTDTKEPSASVKVVSQGDTEVVLAYPLYRNGDPLSSPSGGRRDVRFQLDNGRLTPLDAIPPLSSATGLSRY